MVFNTDGGTTKNFPAAPDYLYAVGVSPDGAIVATGCEDGIVRLYNGANPGQAPKLLVPPGVELPKK